MYYVAIKQKMCYVRYEKPLKNHPLEVAKIIVETYSSSNAAAHDPEERVQLDKLRHYTIYKCKRKGKNQRRGQLTDLEWFKSPVRALNTSWTIPTTTRESLHRAVRIIISDYNYSNVRNYSCSFLTWSVKRRRKIFLTTTRHRSSKSFILCLYKKTIPAKEAKVFFTYSAQRCQMNMEE